MVSIRLIFFLINILKQTTASTNERTLVTATTRVVFFSVYTMVTPKARLLSEFFALRQFTRVETVEQ
jgi:hypothetical protein